MATWMRITTKKDSWPKKTRIVVLLREDSYNGKPLSGDVTIVIRKNNDPSTTTKLGMSDTDLVAPVSNGRWESPEWDYAYWASKGFNTLVALYQGHEWFWSSVATPSAVIKPEPTTISKIHHTSVVDRKEPKQMLYSLTWTILDQRGKPIAGKVTVVFDGTAETRESETDRVGVCFDRVIVEGYGNEMLYSIIPPVGEPQMIKLTGPSPKQQTKVKTLTASSDLGTKVANDTMRYNITLWALDANSSPVGDKQLTWKTGTSNETPVAGLTAGDTGLVTHTVDVIGVDAAVDYQAFSRKDGAVSNELKLKGVKKEKSKDPDNLTWDCSGFPNPDGSFQVTFTTRNGNDPVQGKFFIQASSETTVTELDGSAIGVGRRFPLETDTDGTRILLLNPKDRRTEFAFTNLANNKKYTEEFVKPPAKGKA